MILAKHRVQDALLAAMALFCAAALTLSAAGSLLPAALDALPTGTVGPLVLWENIPDYDDYALISHGVGALNGRTRVAARESFLYNYRLGYRVFECDFVLTSDGYAVLRHDWLGGMQEGVDEDHIPTKAEFSQIPILDQYTPLTFEDLMELMVRFPDIWIVTDFKDTDDASVTALFTALVEEAQALGRPDLLRRMVVQLYTTTSSTICSLSTKQSSTGRRIFWSDMSARRRPWASTTSSCGASSTTSPSSPFWRNTAPGCTSTPSPTPPPPRIFWTGGSTASTPTASTPPPSAAEPPPIPKPSGFGICFLRGKLL